jgi:hypothetical protein
MKHLFLVFVLLLVAINELFAADLKNSSYDGILLAANEVKPVVVTDDTHTSSAGNDVYNFYFQKAPGPVTVIQGGANASTKDSQSEQKLTPTGEPAPSPTEAQNKTNNELTYELKNLKRWEFTVGQGQAGYLYQDDNGRNSMGTNAGLGMQARYNANKYFSFDTLVLLTGAKGFVADESNSARQAFFDEKKSDANIFNISAGAAFTPMRINILGHDLFEFGIVAGLTTVQYYFGDTPRTMVGVYLGPRFAINFSDKVAMVTEYKYLEGQPTRQTSAPLIASIWGLRWKF